MQNIAEVSPAAPGAEETIDRSPNTSETIAAPRALKWELLLFIATCGLYFPYYLYRLVKDLRVTNKDNGLSPFLWIFTPFILLAQIFAYPYLISTLKQAEGKYAIPDPWKLWDKLWIMAMCTVTFTVNLSSKVSMPSWTFPLCFAIYTLLFSVLHGRVNELRKHYASRHQSPMPERQLGAFGWATSLICLPLTAAILLSELLYSQFFGGSVLEKLHYGEKVSAQDHPVEIFITSDHWSRVEIGSHSDGSTIFEIEGSSPDMFMVVYYHGTQVSQEQVTNFRVESASDGIERYKCSENRQFMPDSLNVAARLECRGDYLGEPGVIVSKTVETDKGTYELYGEFFAPTLSFYSEVSSYLAQEKEFRLK